MKRLRPDVKKCGLSLAVGLLIVFAIVWSRGVFDAPSANAAYRLLSDGFFLVGALMCCVGLLSFVSQKGMFDMGAYAMQIFFTRMRLVFLERPDRPKDYHDFKERKNARGRRPLWHLVMMGAVLVVVGAAFAIAYSRFN